MAARELNDLKILDRKLEHFIRGGEKACNAHAFEFVPIYQFQKKRPVHERRVLLCVVDHVVLVAFSHFTELICGESYNEVQFDAPFSLRVSKLIGSIFLLREKTCMGICHCPVVVVEPGQA
jgi:hypothetical protein